MCFTSRLCGRNPNFGARNGSSVSIKQSGSFVYLQSTTSVSLHQFGWNTFGGD
jgi:hypothetical protein